MIRRLAIPVLLLAAGVAACGGPDERRPAPLTVPADSLPLPFSAVAGRSDWRVPGDPVGGEVVVSLTDGDYRLPALSPDGRRIAFAEVARSDTAVRSRVRVRTLDADSGGVLLGWDRVDGYSVADYSPWIFRLAWRGNDTLVVEIADGDVGWTTLTVAASTGRILSESYQQGGRPEPLPPDEAKLRDRILATFPGWRPEVVTSAFHMAQYVEAGDGILLQPRHSADDGHVRWLAWETGDTIRVLTMPRPLERRAALRPGLAVGPRVLFPVARNDTVHLFEFRPGGALAWWGSLSADVGAFPRLREVARAEDGVLAQLDVARGTGCCRHGPVLWITPEGLVEWTDYAPVDDVDARLQHGLVGWTHWIVPDSTRALRVHRLGR